MASQIKMKYYKGTNKKLYRYDSNTGEVSVYNFEHCFWDCSLIGYYDMHLLEHQGFIKEIGVQKLLKIIRKRKG